MTRRTPKSEYVDPFPAQHANIRACVMAPDCQTFYTWLFSGQVMRWTPGGEVESVGMVWNMVSLNALLARYGIAPLEPYTKQKRPAVLEREDSP